MNILCALQGLLDRARAFDFLAPLALRLYLVPVFLMAGMNKFEKTESGSIVTNFGLPVVDENIIGWFGNPDWGLGMPFPDLMAYLASYTEFFGALLLLIGFAVRWISIPLLVTMFVAAFSVHWENGWLAIADAKSCLFNCDELVAAGEKLSAAKGILQEHGNYDWLTGNGSFVILNNGIEFAATYFIMLLALFFIGAGKYVSVDHWIEQRFCKK